MLFNVKWIFFQLYKLHFNVMMMCGLLRRIFIELVHCNNSLWVYMSLPLPYYPDSVYMSLPLPHYPDSVCMSLPLPHNPDSSQPIVALSLLWCVLSRAAVCANCIVFWFDTTWARTNYLIAHVHCSTNVVTCIS